MHVFRSIHNIAKFSRQCCGFGIRQSFFKGGYSNIVYNIKSINRLAPFSISFDHITNVDHKQVYGKHRLFSTSKLMKSEDLLSQSDLKKAIDNLTDQFMETRELLEDARESSGTVYFSDDMEEASDAVKSTLEEYENLLSKLSDIQKKELRRTIGLKMEELKAHQQVLCDES